MLLKIEKLHHIMNFNFFFISCSVIYAKYNYCYEVPREQPLRYFDGKEWKLMKPRHNIRTKAPRHSSISVDLDWAEIIKEIKESEFEETTTTTEMPSCGVSITDTPTATKKATTKRINTKKFLTKAHNTKKLVLKRANTKNSTIKTTAANKITIKKVAPPKIIINPLRRRTQPTTTAAAILKHCRPVCKLKLKSATTTTVDPHHLHPKMTVSGDWRDNWNFLRPTKKHSPVTSKKFTPKATKMVVLQTIKRVSVTTTKKPTTTTKRPVTTTRKPTMKTMRPETSTSKPTMTNMETSTVTKKPLMKMEMPIKLAENQEDELNSPANWSNLLREFLKFVESKKCQRPPCETVTATTTKPYSGYQLAENRKIMSDEDDLMNILMDGVEIDRDIIEREEDDDATQIKDTLEFEGRRLNYESVEDSVSRDSEINSDYVQLLDLESLKDSIETRRDGGGTQIPKKMGYLKGFQSENLKKGSVTSHIREPEVYVDKLRDNNSDEDDDFLENGIKSNSGELKANLAEKEYLTGSIIGSEGDSDELKDKHTKNEDEVVQGIEKKAYSDALKDMRANKNYIFSGIRGSEAHINPQDSEIKSHLDVLTDKLTTINYLFSETREPNLYLDEVKDEIAQKEDEVLQANYIKFNSDTIKGKNNIKDLVTSRVRKSEMNSNKLNVRNTQKEDEVIDDSEIMFYINALKQKHANTGNELPEAIEKRKKYSDVENSQRQDKVNLENESTETFNPKELNEITDYIASKPTYPMKLRSQTNNEDGLQDSDITFD